MVLKARGPLPPRAVRLLRANERLAGPLGAAVIAVAAVLVFWLVLPPRFLVNEASDFTYFYRPVAHNLLAGEGLVDDRGRPATRYPPGFPMALAGLFWLSELLGIDEALALRLFILLCSAIGSVAIFLIARTVSGFPAALLASCGFAAYPFWLWLTKQPNSEVPFVPLLYFGFYFFWTAAIDRGRRLPRCFAGGALLGLAMLVRPSAIGVTVVLAPLFWLWRQDLRASRRLAMMALLLAGNLATVLPWQVWTFHQGKGIIPLSTGGPRTILDGLTFGVRNKTWRQGTQIPGDVESLMRRINARDAEMEMRLGGALRVVLEEARENPPAMVKLMLLKVVRCWHATDSQRFESAALILQIPFLLLFLACSRIAWRRGELPRRLAQGTWVMVVYFWCISTVTYSLIRYLAPAAGLLFVLLPRGAAVARQDRRPARSDRLAAPRPARSRPDRPAFMVPRGEG